MSDFKSEKKDVESRLENLEKDAPASQLEETPEVTEAKPVKKPSFLSSSYKTRATVAKIAAIEPERPMPSVPVEVKEHIAETKAVGKAIIEQEKLETELNQVIDVESMYAQAATAKLDKAIFCQEADNCMPFNLDQLRDRLHELMNGITELNSRAQAVLGTRAQRLKDVSAEERARRMKEDFEFKTPKRSSATASTTKAERKPKESMDAQMVRTLTAKFMAKGMTQTEAEKKAKERVKDMLS